MIIKGLFELIYLLLQIVFAPIALPQLPDSVNSVINQLISIIKGGVSLLAYFVDLNMLITLLPILLVIINFDKIWRMIMFILRKIPFLGIK